jgi:hypothetical protein
VKQALRGLKASLDQLVRMELTELMAQTALQVPQARKVKLEPLAPLGLRVHRVFKGSKAFKAKLVLQDPQVPTVPMVQLGLKATLALVFQPAEMLDKSLQSLTEQTTALPGLTTTPTGLRKLSTKLNWANQFLKVKLFM